MDQGLRVDRKDEQEQRYMGVATERTSGMGYMLCGGGRR